MAVPAVVVGLAATGIVTAATGSTVAAPPAGQAATGTAGAGTGAAAREQGTSRTENRPALADSGVGSARAAGVQQGQEKQAPKQDPKPKVPTTSAVGRLPEVKTPPLTVVDTEFTRVDLNVRSQAKVDSTLLTVLEAGSEVRVTKTVSGSWRWIVQKGEGGWVKDQYLVESKPTTDDDSASDDDASGSTGISSGACPGGSAVESGLTADAVRVHRAICARFPGITAFGGVRADSLPEHPSGRALDAMVPSNALGWEVATWVRANSDRLGVSQLLFAQRIWTVERGDEGWRSFSDRGSATANHEDHVHITVYGSAGG